jgi:hypothetical protein
MKGLKDGFPLDTCGNDDSACHTRMPLSGIHYTTSEMSIFKVKD